MQPESSIQKLVEWVFSIQGLADFVPFRILIQQSEQPNGETRSIFPFELEELLDAFLLPLVVRSQC